MEKHKLLELVNYQLNFFGDQDEVNCLKHICGYICTHIITKDENKKASEIQLETAMFYITTQIQRLCLLEYDLIIYVSALLDKVIKVYSEEDEFIYCLNLLNLKTLFDAFYKENLERTYQK